MASQHSRTVIIDETAKKFASLSSIILYIRKEKGNWIEAFERFFINNFGSTSKRLPSKVSRVVLINRERNKEYHLNTSRECLFIPPLQGKTKVKSLGGAHNIKEIVFGVYLKGGAATIKEVLIDGYIECGGENENFNFRIDDRSLMSMERPTYWVDVSVKTEKKLRKKGALSIYLTRAEIKPKQIFKKENGDGIFLSVQPNRYREGSRAPLIFLLSFDGVTREHFYSVDQNGERIFKNYFKLSNESVVFERAVSSGTVTGSSAASLLTGLPFSKHFVYDYDEKYYSGKLQKISLNLMTLPELLRKNSFNCYGVSAFSKWRPHYGYSRGFDRYTHICTGSLHNHAFLEKGIEYLSNSETSDSFVLMHLPGGHPPYKPSYREKGAASTQEGIYYSNLLNIDRIIQTFVGYLKEGDLFDDSMIVLMSDHGNSLYPYRRKGYQFREGRLHIPFLVKLPKCFPESEKYQKVSGEIVSATSLVYSIVCDVLGIDTPDYIEDAFQEDKSTIKWVSECVDYESLNRVGIVGYDATFKWVLYFAFDIYSREIGEIIQIGAYRIASNGFADDDQNEIDSFEDSARNHVIEEAKSFLGVGQKYREVFQPLHQKEDVKVL